MSGPARLYSLWVHTTDVILCLHAICGDSGDMMENYNIVVICMSPTSLMMDRQMTSAPEPRIAESLHGDVRARGI